MITETVLHLCRRFGSSKIVKNGTTPAAVSSCGARIAAEAVFSSHVADTEEQKEQILAAYHERPSMRGIERIVGVSRDTLAKWLKTAPTRR